MQGDTCRGLFMNLRCPTWFKHVYIKGVPKTEYNMNIYVKPLVPLL